jgi:hypothetical protein
MNRNRICRCATCWPNIGRIRCARRVTRASIRSVWRLKGTDRWEMHGRRIWRDGRWIQPSPIRADVQGTGLAGLQAFIREHRQKEFVNNLSRKLLAYALNRSLQLSDESLVELMESQGRRKSVSI